MVVKSGSRVAALLISVSAGILLCVWIPSVENFLSVQPQRLLSRVSPSTSQGASFSRSQHSSKIGATRSGNVISSAVGLLAFAFAAALGRSRQSPCRALRPHQGGRQQVSSTACAAGPVLTLGTRASPLALAQAYEAKRLLAETYAELAADDAVEIRSISTTGDERLDISLAQIGGKGLFTRELDVALLSKEVDFCVHSTKDVPTQLAPGTELCTMLPREDTRDVIITHDSSISRVEDLPDGSIIGTASLRRQAQIMAKNPTLKCVNFRGNVQTRLRKLRDGEVDATFLAYAGLKRMNMEHHATRVLELEEMLPATAQGAISFQCRSDDEKTKKYLQTLSHAPTVQAVTCERAFLAALDGNCKTPIAGLAQVIDGQLHFEGLAASPDGQQIFRVERTGSLDDAAKLGREAGMQIRSEAGEEFFEMMQEYVQDMQAANEAPNTA